MRAFAGLCAALLLASFVPLRSAEPELVPQPERDPVGRTAVVIPERTDQGNWDGTWVYANRDAKYALWLRTREDGRPEARLKFESTSTPETFETGWDGRAEYALSGKPVTFAFVLERGDANLLAGTWNWDAQFGSAFRKDVGTFEAFRAGDGRALVLRFKTYERSVKRKGEVRTSQALPIWTFRKVSKQQARWEELPF